MCSRSEWLHLVAERKRRAAPRCLGRSLALVAARKRRAALRCLGRSLALVAVRKRRAAPRCLGRSLALVAVPKRRAAPRCLGVGPSGTALRYSPPPARKKAKAFFRLKPPASAPFLDDAPKAAQRRPPLALGTVSLDCGERKTSRARQCLTAAAGAAAPPIEASPEERIRAGAVKRKNALAFFRAGSASTAVVATLVADAFGGAAAPAAAARRR